MMRQVPWIAMMLAAVVVFNPLGLDIIQAAFFSGGQLSRNIWQPIAITAGLILTLLIALEWWLRRRWAARA
jgi:hypothetical protein